MKTTVKYFGSKNYFIKMIWTLYAFFIDCRNYFYYLYFRIIPTYFIRFNGYFANYFNHIYYYTDYCLSIIIVMRFFTIL